MLFNFMDMCSPRVIPIQMNRFIIIRCLYMYAMGLRFRRLSSVVIISNAVVNESGFVITDRSLGRTEVNRDSLCFCGKTYSKIFEIF